MADSSSTQAQQRGSATERECAPAAASRLSGQYRLDVSRDDGSPVVHVKGPVRFRLSETHRASTSGLGTGLQLRIDASAADAITLSVEQHDERWYLDLTPSSVDCAPSDLLYRATHDELTGLANREQFIDHVRMALARTRRAETTLGVLYLDLDGFKTVNDVYGHWAGDLVLAEVGRRLRAVSRPMDLAARLGGDEFALACENLDSPIEAGVIARRVVDAIASPMSIEGRHLSVSASVGIALSEKTSTAPELLQWADSAMYKAKTDAMASVRMQSESDQLRVDARQERATSVRAALAADRLDIVYRSIHAIDGSGVIAIEADWERTGSAVSAGWDEPSLPRDVEDDLAMRLLEQTTRDLTAIRAAGLDEGVPIHVRLPSRLLLDVGLADLIADLSARSDLSPGEIALDVDESLTDMRMAAPGIQRLRDAGVPISIVGFGTQRSSLSGLATTPAQVLKIDRELVADADTTRRGEAVLAAIVDLAHAHSMIAVAQGVETRRRLDILRFLGCDAAEGSVFSGPRSKDELLFAIGAGLCVA